MKRMVWKPVSDEFMRLFIEEGAKYRHKESELRAKLVDLGIKAAHPHDGWVEHDQKGNATSVILCYPLFVYRDIVAGDTLALYAIQGQGYEYSLWRVTEVKDNPWATALGQDVGFRARKYMLEQAKGEEQRD